MKNIEYEESLNSLIDDKAEQAWQEDNQSDVVFVSATSTSKEQASPRMKTIAFQ